MLQSFIKIAPLLPQLLGIEKVCVWATDEEKYILFRNEASLPLGIEEGTPLKEGGTPSLVMKAKKAVDRVVPREVYGTTFRSVCIPVSGGTVGLSVDLEEQQQIQESIEQLSSFAQQVATSAVETADQTQVVHLSVEKVSQLSKTGIKCRQSLEQVTSVLREITDHLQLLSLNALIEAARAGEYGRTFNIVANEVKKLSHSGKDHLSEINSVIHEVSRLLEDIGREMDSIRHFTDSQTTHANQLACSIQSVTSNLENLSQLNRRKYS